jgi:hypothetical protein
MVSAFLLHRSDRYHIKGREIMAGQCKYYANDPAFRNLLYPGTESGAGYMLENIVYLQLRGAGYQVFTGHIRDKEIDFVAMKHDRTIYLQVSYLLADQSVIEREYGQLEAIPDNFEKFVVTLDDLVMPNRRGVKHVQAWKLEEVL